VKDFHVEIAENGPWLASDGTVTAVWEERGRWNTQDDAQAALAASLQTEEEP
jgi:hypothetical protein